MSNHHTTLPLLAPHSDNVNSLKISPCHSDVKIQYHQRQQQQLQSIPVHQSQQQGHQEGNISFNNGLGFNRRPPGKRLRVPTSCSICRRRKIRCDKEKPCTSCVKSKIPHLCEYKEPSWVEDAQELHNQQQRQQEEQQYSGISAQYGFVPKRQKYNSDSQTGALLKHSPNYSPPETSSLNHILNSGITNSETGTMISRSPFSEISPASCNNPHTPSSVASNSTSHTTSYSLPNIYESLNQLPTPPQNLNQQQQQQIITQLPSLNHGNVTANIPSLHRTSQGSSDSTSFNKSGHIETSASSSPSSTSSNKKQPESNTINNSQEVVENRTKLLESSSSGYHENSNHNVNLEILSYPKDLNYGFDVNQKFIQDNTMKFFNDFKSLSEDFNFHRLIDEVKLKLQKNELKFKEVSTFAKIPSNSTNIKKMKNRSDEELITAVLEVLPTKKQTMSLISKYFENFNLIYNIFNKYDFLQDFKTILPYDKDNDKEKFDTIKHELQNSCFLVLGQVLMILQISLICLPVYESNNSSSDHILFNLSEECLNRYDLDEEFDEFQEKDQIRLIQLKLVLSMYPQFTKVSNLCNFTNNDVSSIDVSILLNLGFRMGLTSYKVQGQRLEIWRLIISLGQWCSYRTGVPMLTVDFNVDDEKIRIIGKVNQLLFFNGSSSSILDFLDVINRIDNLLRSQNSSTIEQILKKSTEEEHQQIQKINTFAQLTAIKLKLQAFLLDIFIKSSNQRQIFIYLNSLLDTSIQINIDLLNLFKYDHSDDIYFYKLKPLSLVGSSLLTLCLTIVKTISKILLKLNSTSQSLETTQFHHSLTTLHDSSIQLVQFLLSSLSPSKNTLKLSIICTILKDLAPRYQTSNDFPEIILMKQEITYLSTKTSKFQTLQAFISAMPYNGKPINDTQVQTTTNSPRDVFKLINNRNDRHLDVLLNEETSITLTTDLHKKEENLNIIWEIVGKFNV